MRKAYANQFIVIAALVAITAAGQALLTVSTRVCQAEIELTPGRRVEIPVLSPFGNTLRLKAEFGLHGRQTRPELGTWQTRTGDSNILDFANPGALVVIQAVVPNGAAVTLRAAPADSFGVHGISRSLYPATSHIHSSAFSWPPYRDQPPLALPAGWGSVSVTVLEAADELRGEVVKLRALPPLSFKSCQPGYCWLGWFFLWPWIAVPTLAVWLIVLSYFVWRGSQAHEVGEK